MHHAGEDVAARLNIHRRLADKARPLWLLAAALVYLALGAYQLGLPGLHYDEAKEAGINAMELIAGAPITAFRGASVELFGTRLPLMVQDYIGALNVYLAAPILALTGVGVPNLRALSLLTGLLTLLFAERAISEWIAFCDLKAGGKDAGAGGSPDAATGRTRISLAGVVAVSLLAVSPTFVFWSRQGIFVTNLMQPFCFLSVWQGVRWMRTGRPSALVWSAFAAGLALYAKLLAVWIVGPVALMLIGWWAYRRTRGVQAPPRISSGLLLVSMGAFVLPLAPVALFNLETGGTLSLLLDNAGRSYYGVDNLSVLANLGVRASQLVQVLRGDQLWYLGATYANSLAPLLALLSIAGGVWRAPRCTLPPVILVAAAVLMSVFTISDLFVTHYGLIYPFVIAAAAIALDRLWASSSGSGEWSRPAHAVIGLMVVLWIASNLVTSVLYHRSLTESGGLADHSDASYHLAYYLRYSGLGAPVALDWGIEAPVRFLSQNAVKPIEVFGYTSLDGPDDEFGARLEQFLENPDNTYLLHDAGHTVFEGRREAFLSAVAEKDLFAEPEKKFGQRDGQPLYEVWRVHPVLAVE